MSILGIGYSFIFFRRRFALEQLLIPVWVKVLSPMMVHVSILSLRSFPTQLGLADYVCFQVDLLSGKSDYFSLYAALHPFLLGRQLWVAAQPRLSDQHSGKPLLSLSVGLLPTKEK